MTSDVLVESVQHFLFQVIVAGFNLIKGDAFTFRHLMD